MINTFPCIVPCIKNDYERMHLYFPRLFECLPVSKIVFIGPSSLSEVISSDISSNLYSNHTVEFLNENDLIDLASLIPTYNSLAEKCTLKRRSTVNWYYQQFLKMTYAQLCDQPYYFSWDADTIPLKKIQLFAPNGCPYFDIKTEYCPSYFKTINKLFGYNKIIEKSFISEHMLFTTEFMLDLISQINKLDIAGTTFYEKIMNAVGSNNLDIGFSEFETYGTWVGVNHPSAYILRNWMSFRSIGYFTDLSQFKQDDIDWLSIDYDAVSFEKYNTVMPDLNVLFNDYEMRNKMTPKEFYTVVLESGFFGDYENNAIKLEDRYIPT